MPNAIALMLHAWNGRHFFVVPVWQCTVVCLFPCPVRTKTCSMIFSLSWPHQSGIIGFHLILGGPAAKLCKCHDVHSRAACPGRRSLSRSIALPYACAAGPWSLPRPRRSTIAVAFCVASNPLIAMHLGSPESGVLFCQSAPSSRAFATLDR